MHQQVGVIIHTIETQSLHELIQLEAVIIRRVHQIETDPVV